jgi:pilus assembly protein Flp/PilA
MDFGPASRMTLGWDRMVSFCLEDDGQDLIEYALVAGLIGLSAVLSMNSVTTKIKNAFNTIGSQLTSAV